MTRREAIGVLGAAASGNAAGVESIRSRLPKGIPPGVATIMANTLQEPPGSLNTDWFGTCLVQGLLEWAPNGMPELVQFGKEWLGFHIQDASVSKYSGPKARVYKVGGVPVTTYAGHFGIAFPCWELFRQTGDSRARRVCLDMANVILHRTTRDRFGMVLSDDDCDFGIPDVCYFTVTPLMIASRMESADAVAYREQAVYQLRTFIDHFLIKQTGLAKTILRKDGLGKTYWTRATGWLLWSITGVLRHLPENDPAFPGFLADLQTLGTGIARHQDSTGALHVLVDDPGTPLETTGTAMCALGLHESVRKGWLPDSFRPTIDHAWTFVQGNIGLDGKIRRVYTGWAVTAEQGVMEMDTLDMGWISGFILSAAHEMIL